MIALRSKYELLANDVLTDHLELIEAALNRRLFTCGGFTPNEAIEKYVSALSELSRDGKRSSKPTKKYNTPLSGSRARSEKPGSSAQST